jgi:hypothetical protein
MFDNLLVCVCELLRTSCKWPLIIMFLPTHLLFLWLYAEDGNGWGSYLWQTHIFLILSTVQSLLAWWYEGIHFWGWRGHGPDFPVTSNRMMMMVEIGLLMMVTYGNSETWMLMLVFKVMARCGLVSGYQRFGGTYCLHLQGLSGRLLGSGRFKKN